MSAICIEPIMKTADEPNRQRIVTPMATGNYAGLLKSSGFQCFLWTQFLGAFNDNAYKYVLSIVAVELAPSPADASKYLSMVLAVFILPFLLFSGYAGHAADARNKRTVLIATKSFEILAMTAAYFAFLSRHVEVMLGVLFLTTLQATFFSPAKYGIVPEMVPDKDLSRANGLLEMSTFLAIVLGSTVGGVLLLLWPGQPHRIALLMIAIAVVGTATSFGISRVYGPVRRQPFRWNPWAEVWDGTARLYRDKPLWLTVIAISYFFFLGALVQTELILFGKQVLHADDFWTAILGAFLAVGIAGGSMAAGRLSGDKVELGLVPLGSIFMGVSALLLARATASYRAAASALALIGFSAGLFIVPLNAFLQQRAGENEKGRLIATNNFLNTAGILLASGALWAMGDRMGLPADRVILIFGFVTFLVTVYILTVLPDFLIRFTLWMLTHTIYRIRIVGQDNVPFRGPALLVSNHV